MRLLKTEELSRVSAALMASDEGGGGEGGGGGGTPLLACSSVVNGNTTTQTCETAYKTTVITTCVSPETSGSLVASFREIFKLGGDGKSTTPACTTIIDDHKGNIIITDPNGKTTVVHPNLSSNEFFDAVDEVGMDIARDNFGSWESYAGGDYGGGGGGGCVQVSSLLPDGTLAGDIRVGASMQLSDEKDLQADTGIVTFSKRKTAPGFRFTTVSGISLVCSDTAPIPTPEGLVLAPKLLGKSVAVRRDEGGTTHSAWELVKSVDAIGDIEVQHITVGEKCFWAGEKANGYILHHNMKADDGGDYGYEDDWSSYFC
jgi:hypothetical protein